VPDGAHVDIRLQRFYIRFLNKRKKLKDVLSGFKTREKKLKDVSSGFIRFLNKRRKN
jgi:hypothetical protein